MVRRIDDIEKDLEEKDREEFKDKITNDVKDMVERLKPKKKRRSSLIRIFIWLVLTGLVILAINFVLGNVWLLRFFIKSLFGVG